MDVFALRDQLVEDYRHYAESFLTIKDERVREHVKRDLDEGLLWPDPSLQLNPAFESGGQIDDLVGDGLLHPECSRIFRVGKQAEAGSTGEPLRLHRHQADAVRAARAGQNYVLTTGTGSGKSLAYIVPIVDHVLRAREGGAAGRRIAAIVVYPMNALANSQEEELRKFLSHGYPDGRGPVTFRRFTGQENDEQREEIRSHPPDILLTNYVMLEYILTRPVRPGARPGRGGPLLPRARRAAHVPRPSGRRRGAARPPRSGCLQGAEPAGASARRPRSPAPAPTPSSGPRWLRVASRLFGTTVEPDAVIGETLRPATSEVDHSDPAFIEQLTNAHHERIRPRPTSRRSPTRSPAGSSERSGSPTTRPTPATPAAGRGR